MVSGAVRMLALPPLGSRDRWISLVTHCRIRNSGLCVRFLAQDATRRKDCVVQNFAVKKGCSRNPWFSSKRQSWSRQSRQLSVSSNVEEPLPSDAEQRHTTIILRLSKLINSFRHRGHFAAMIDPLRGSAHKKLNPLEPIHWRIDDNVDVCRLLKNYPTLDLAPYGLEGVDPEQGFAVGNEIKSLHPGKLWTIRQIVEHLRACYCGSTTVEYMHVSDEAQREWIQDIFEGGLGGPAGLGGVGGGGGDVAAAGGGAEEPWSFYRGRLLGTLEPPSQLQILEQLVRADHLERYLGAKFPSVKRFGLEGGEALLPGLHALVAQATALGVEAVELGMAHRGRLNVLANLFRKPLGAICNEFEDKGVSISDVKYHLGTYCEVDFNGRKCHMSLAANPSHLEAVNPVVVGKARAKQYFIKDDERRRVMAVLLHGDAAFSGQGIVAECMELSDIPAYTTGGTVHVVINNMIGFTTDPRASRSSYHCTNVAKGVEAPIVHVNGDDVEAVVHACRLAARWRQTFRKDVVVDMVCYRRHGHNELDEPCLTQPLTYAEIRRHPTALALYSAHLIRRGACDAGRVRRLSEAVLAEYEAEHAAAAQHVTRPQDWLASNWQGVAINALTDSGARPFNPTGMPAARLLQVGLAACRLPEGFRAHPQVVQLMEERSARLREGSIDMALAEVLAFGTLMLPFKPDAPIFGRIRRDTPLTAPGGPAAAASAAHNGAAAHADGEPAANGGGSCAAGGGGGEAERSLGMTADALKGVPEALVQYVDHPTVDVRLSGQDSERGTFNQRHAVIYDQDTARPYTPLNNLGLGPQAALQVCNSSLSEAAVLGFEYGYSLESDLALTIWEAQFGDFANVGQHIIDNFIAAGECKWNQKSGLVILLPHGYDGQGPEHSSARLERYLQLVDDDPDVVPGSGDGTAEELRRAWAILDADGDGRVAAADLAGFLKRVATRSDAAAGLSALGAAAGAAAGVAAGPDGSSTGGRFVTREEYFMFAAGWARRNAERRHNLCVVYCSTPAQYFHALRRQIHRPFTKPLVAMAAKYMLHHRACRSPLEHMGPNTAFARTIIEGGPADNTAARGYALVPPARVRRVVFCAGKFYYDLYHARAARRLQDVVFVRVEQIAPFPFEEVAAAAAAYPSAELVWAQEEPKNMGAYAYVAPRFATALRAFGGTSAPAASAPAAPAFGATAAAESVPAAATTAAASPMAASAGGSGVGGSGARALLYRGRPASASPATGSFREHQNEMRDLVAAALVG